MRSSSITHWLAIPLTIQNIYRDIDNYARNWQIEASDKTRKLIRNLTGAHLALYKERINTVGSQLNIPMLGYMLRSTNFIHAMVELDQALFITLLEILQENVPSLLIFARVRLPSIQNNDDKSIQWLHGLSRKKDHHFYVVPRGGQRVAITPTFVDTCEDNVFDVSDFRSLAPPTGWSDTIGWPSHPGIRHPKTTCCICGTSNICPCEPPRISSGQYLVETRQYGKKGRGVRTLQRIQKAEIIGEFVGRFLPINANIDETWAISFKNAPPDEPWNDIPIAKLDAGSVGNWTRFINHHCSEPNVQFFFADVGGYHRVLVQAIKDIEVYTELLANYGPNHWKTRKCHCGSSSCYNPTPTTQTSKNTTTSKPSQQTSKTNKTTPAAQPSDPKPRRSYLMPTQHHSDIDPDSEDSTKPPTRRIPHSTRTKNKSNKNESKANPKNEEENDTAAQRHEEALARRADKRATRRERAAWRKRWIGQDNADKPRHKGGKRTGPYFAEF